jgi:flagellar basal-body rod protein FlgF
MDPAYYVAAGSLKARSFQLDTVSNNLANMATVGYKTERSFFSVFNKAAREGQGLALSPFVNDGTVSAYRGMDFSQGNLRPTGRSLDLAIDGNAFFMVQTPQGVRATRDGRFQLGKGGQLTALDGASLLGKNGQPITVNPAAGPITVLQDGTVQQGTATVGQISLKAFANPAALTRVGNTRFDPSGSAEGPVNATVSQGNLEQSGVDMATAMIDMIRLNRLFEMSMKVASTITNDLDARSISDIAPGR